MSHLIDSFGATVTQNHAFIAFISRFVCNRCFCQYDKYRCDMIRVHVDRTVTSIGARCTYEINLSYYLADGNSSSFFSHLHHSTSSQSLDRQQTKWNALLRKQITAARHKKCRFFSVFHWARKCQTNVNVYKRLKNWTNVSKKSQTKLHISNERKHLFIVNCWLRSVIEYVRWMSNWTRHKETKTAG